MKLIRTPVNATPKNLLENQRRYRERNIEKRREAVARSTAKQDPAVRRAKERERNERVRVQSFMLHGGQCSRCGFNDMRALQFDHVNGGGTKENAKIKARGVARRAMTFPLEYQVLCANCNWVKRHEKGENKQRIDASEGRLQ